VDSGQREGSPQPASPNEVIIMKDEIKMLVEDLTSGNDQLAEIASIKLAALDREVLPTLEQNLASKDIDDRWWAVRTLAQMDSPPMELLLNALEDPAQEVRQCASLAICHNPDSRAIKPLLCLLKEQDSVSSNLAATALISIGKESIPRLMEFYQELSGVSRIEAARAIACIEDQRAIKLLMSALDEDSLAINYWAEEGLNRLGLGMVYLKPE
jgi:HEAT repeat protein